MTVLVGYVPTPLGEATLRAGVEESRRRAEPLLVVNMSRDDVLVDAHRAARDDLDRVERDVTELGVDVEVVRIEQGSDPADALVRVAEERRRLGDRHRAAPPHPGGQAHHGLDRAADPARRPVPGARRQGGRRVSVSTADLWDEHGDALQSCSVQLRHFGGRTAFTGRDQHGAVPPRQRPRQGRPRRARRRSGARRRRRRLARVGAHGRPHRGLRRRARLGRGRHPRRGA